MLDWPTHLLHAALGGVGFLDIVASAYRVHPGGVWSGRSLRDRYASTVAMADILLDNEVFPSLRPQLTTLRATWQDELVAELSDLGDRRSARRVFIRSLGHRPFDRGRLKTRAKTLLTLYRPRRAVRGLAGPTR